MAFYDRTVMVLGDEYYQKIINKHIILVGVGGVGGAVLECLARFGIKKITIIDFDKVDITNINRQLISNMDTVGMLKTDAAKQRVLSINPECDITAFNMFIGADNVNIIGSLSPDYVIDAIDSVKSKLDLIEYCHKNDIKIVSSMGTGNRFRADGFVIDKVESSAGNGCGLSKIMRHELKKRGIEGHISLYNTIPPLTKVTNADSGRHSPGSTPFAPNVAGILIAQYVCEQLAKE